MEQKTNLLTSSTHLTQFLENNQYKNFTEEQKEIVIALNYPKIKEIDIQDFINLLIGLIGKTHLNCGMDMNKDGRIDLINVTVEELAQDLKKYNGFLTFKEIEIAFKNGWKMKYGEFHGLNNKTYFGWINSYCYNEMRLNVIKTMLNQKEKENNKPELSEIEKDNILKNGALSCFENYKSTKQIKDYGNVTYNFLVKSGQINYTKELKDEIMKRAKQKLIKEKELELTKSISLFEIKVIKDTIRNLDDKSNILIQEAKKEALKQYFDNLIELNNNLEL